MSKSIQTTRKMNSLTGLGLSGLVVLAAFALPVSSASAQVVEIKLDGKNFELKKKRNNGSSDQTSNIGDDKRPTLVAPKGDRDAEAGGPIVAKRVVGKGDRDDDIQTGNQQIVIGKSDRAEEDERPVKRQVIVEPKPKKKIVVAETAPKPKKKVVVAKAEEPKLEVVADAAPAEEAPVVTEEEAPAAEEQTQAVEETPAETPKQTFEVGQIVTAADGNQYIVVKVNEASVSVYPLSAYVAEQPVHKVYKKKRYKKRYSSYGYSSKRRSYGGYSGCN